MHPGAVCGIHPTSRKHTPHTLHRLIWNWDALIVSLFNEFNLGIKSYGNTLLSFNIIDTKIYHRKVWATILRFISNAGELNHLPYLSSTSVYILGSNDRFFDKLYDGSWPE